MRVDALTPSPMIVATSPQAGRAGLAALMMAIRNCLSAASSHVIFGLSQTPEGMMDLVRCNEGRRIGCNVQKRWRWRGARLSEVKARFQRCSAYPTTLVVKPSPIIAATSANFGRDGPAALIMAIKSFRSVASSQVTFATTACPFGMLNVLRRYMVELEGSCLFDGVRGS